MGSGYGGKHTGEHAIEAARLAKAAGAPVKLVYTRAEEFSWGYFRPAGVIDDRAGVDASNNCRLGVRQLELGQLRIDDAVHDRANSASISMRPETPLRQGSYRGLAATANHYAREMHMDAIARALETIRCSFVSTTC
jgi:isoquinoline 1-oxidoreductase